MSQAASSGRRERKKARTRDALRASARRLFAEQGFAATTVEQIADAADVSERTFFRYFESKEDLLLPDVVAVFESVGRAIRERPIDEPPLASILEAFRAVMAGPSLSGGMSLLGPGFDPSDPVVAGRMVKAFLDWEDRLADVLRERFIRAGAAGAEAELALHASVVARAAVSAARATLRVLRGRQVDDEVRPGSTLRALDDAFAVLAAGCPSPAPMSGAGGG